MRVAKGKTKRKICAIFIALTMILLNITSAFGATIKFTDISSHWARPYIEKLTAARITTGVEVKNGVGKYAPEAPVKRIEVITMLIRLLGLEEEAKTMTLPSSFPKASEVPSWGKGIVAMAISKGIIPTNRDFKANADALREDVAIMAVRALGFAKEAESKTTIDTKILNFSDLSLMSLEARPYVEVAVEKGIMAGIGENKFDPKGKFTRGQMAKLIDNSLQYKDLKGQVVGVVDSVETDHLRNITLRLTNGTLRTYSVDKDAGLYKRLADNNLDRISLNNIKSGDRVCILPDDKPNYTYYVEVLSQKTQDTSGQVKGIIKDVSSTFRRVTVSKTGGEEEEFLINVGVNIYIDGKLGNIMDLSPGQPVTLTLSQGEVVKVDVQKIQGAKTVKGTLRTVLANVISLRDDDTGTTKSYKTDASTQYYREGNRVSPQDLIVGDMVELKVLGDTALEIDAKSPVQEISGYIKNLNLVPRDPIITVEISKGQEKSFEFDSKVSITKNRDRYAQAEDLKKGDEVVLKLEYNKVVNIVATSVKTNVKGTIKSITLEKETTRIVIVDNEGAEHAFFVTADTDLREGRRRFDREDLKIGYHLDVEMENDEATYVQVTVQEELQTFVGIINTINSRREIMILDVGKETQDIYYNSDTVFIKGKDTTTIRRVDEGDKVVVIGEYVDGVFEAYSIAVLNID